MVTLNLRYAEFNTHAWHHRGDIHLLYCFWLLYNNCAKWGKFSCSCKARRNKDSLQHKNVCFLSFFSPHFSVCIRKNVERPEYCCSKTEFLKKKSMCNCCYSHKCCNYLQSVKKALKGNTLVHLIDSLLLFEMLLLFIVMREYMQENRAESCPWLTHIWVSDMNTAY